MVPPPPRRQLPRFCRPFTAYETIMSSLEVTECDNHPLTAALASNDNDAGIFLSLTSSSAESDLSNTSLPQQLPSRHDPPGSFAWKRWILLLVLLLGIVYALLDSTIGGGNVERIILGFLDWVERNPIRGALCVCIVYIFATILFVPGSIMTLGAGYALGSAVPGPMGVLLATTAVFVGASIGSICSFLLGRYLFRDCVLRLAAGYRLFRAIDAALQGNGLKIMILLRLSPLIPYNALDYMSGVTAIPLRDYSLACIALLPGALMLCFIGASAPSLAESTSGATGASRAVKIITIVTGVVFGGSGIFAASYYSKKELDRILAAQSPVISSAHDDEYGTNEDELLPETFT